MKQTNRGKQMKSVWEGIRPPEPWEKRFGKHPTQKPVALLERILLASTNEGDLVLDPFAGSGTTLLAALRLSRQAAGCELSLDYVSLSIRRLCSEMVQIELSLSRIEFSLDLDSDPMDRSYPPPLVSGHGFSRAVTGGKTIRLQPLRASLLACMPPQLQLVQQERRFYFVGRTKREILFTVLADSLDEAQQRFRNAGHSDSDALFIIKTETEIYLA